MSSASKEMATGPGQLGLWSTVSVIVGIVIGTTIYKVPWLIFSNTASPIWGLLVWAFGGVIALIGAFCYAELATTYPKAGGDYYYLTRAFGSGTGFLFGWAQLVVVMPASIGAMATVFADYAQQAFVPSDVILSFEVPFVEGVPPIDPSFVIAACAVGLLTLTNVFGVMLGKVVQNLLTMTKVIGLGGIVVIGFWFAEPNAWDHTPKTHTFDRYNDQLTNIVGRQTVGRRAFTIERSSDPSAKGAEPEGVKGIRSELALPLFGSLAMILVMYAFGGWSDCAFVAAEVRNPRRNIPRALFLGIGIIVVVYLLVNAAYISGLGWDNVSRYNPDIPGSVIAKALDENGAKAMQILVMISALGAVNGLVFTGARVYATLGADHILFGWMGHWRPGKRAPVMALLLQGLVTVFLVFAITTKDGHEWIIKALDGINQGIAQANERLEDVLPNREIRPIERTYDMPWNPEQGFETLVARTAPVFWVFFLLTGLSLFRLRERDPGIERPFSVPCYPLIPLLFCLSCAWMLYRTVIYVEWHCLFAIVLVLVGLPLYWLSSLIRRPQGGGSTDQRLTPVTRLR
jgi:amino acid transporter